MPNHISNIITFEGEESKVKELLAFINGGDDQLIDFDKIIPMPKELDVESGTRGEVAMLYLRNSKRPNKEEGYERAKAYIDGLSEEGREKALELGRAYIHNKVRYGHETWYPWRIDKWGTKWNAYDIYKEDYKTIWFNTAWSAPIPVIMALSSFFPDVTIIHTWADEDAGYNCGACEYIDGETVYENIPEGGTDDAMQLYFKTHPGSEDYYVKDENGEWKWRDDD